MTHLSFTSHSLLSIERAFVVDQDSLILIWSIDRKYDVDITAFEGDNIYLNGTDNTGNDNDEPNVNLIFIMGMDIDSDNSINKMRNNECVNNCW